MNIGIIGAGRIGGTVGTLWARAGHTVLFGSRHPEHLRALIAEAGNGARAGTVAEAAAFGAAVLFAPPFDATDEVLSAVGAGSGALDGKILIDATNPYKQDLSGLALPAMTTAAEELQRKVPRARLVKAYNTLPATLLADDAHRPAGQQYVLFYSGAEAAAKTIVAGLIADSGFAPVNAGALSDAYHQEPRGPLYWQAADRRGGPRAAAHAGDHGRGPVSSSRVKRRLSHPSLRATGTSPPARRRRRRRAEP